MNSGEITYDTKALLDKLNDVEESLDNIDDSLQTLSTFMDELIDVLVGIRIGTNPNIRYPSRVEWLKDRPKVKAQREDE